MSWWWLLVPAYFVVGYLLKCLTVRMEWKVLLRRGATYPESERRDTERLIQYLWPGTFPFAVVYFVTMSKPKRWALTEFLSTPVEVRKGKALK